MESSVWLESFFQRKDLSWCFPNSAKRLCPHDCTPMHGPREVAHMSAERSGRSLGISTADCDWQCTTGLSSHSHHSGTSNKRFENCHFFCIAANYFLLVQEDCAIFAGAELSAASARGLVECHTHQSYQERHINTGSAPI
jgi:hypothetical protein